MSDRRILVKLLHELMDFVRHDTKSAITMIKWVVAGIGFVALISIMGFLQSLGFSS